MVRSGGLRGQVADFGVVLVVVAIVVVSFAGIAVADEPDPGDIDSEITISEPPDSIAPGQEFETDVSFSLYNPACASYTIVLYEVDRGVVTNDRTKIAEKKYLLSATEVNTPVTVSGETLDGDGQAALRAEIHTECSTGTGASSDIFEVPVTEPPENDRFEPNDEWQSAFPVSDSTFTSSRGQITPGDIDWYQLPVSEGQTLSVEAAARTQNGELRMRVYAPDGSGDFRSASGLDAQIRGIPADGPAYIALAGSTDDTTASYVLDISRETPENDRYEANDRYQAAQSIEPGYYDRLRIAPEDIDWYKIPVTAGDSLSVDVTNFSDDTTLFASVYTPEGNGEYTEYTGLDATAEGVAASGTAYIAVTAGADSETADYALDVARETPENDRFEPNDRYQSAASLSAGIYRNLRVTPGDVDWYKVSVTEGERLAAELGSVSGAETLEMVTYVPEGAGDFEEFSGTDTAVESVPATGTAYVALAGRSESVAASYSLTIDIQEPLENDRFEPNERYQSAARIGPGSYTDLRITPGDIDWYAIPVSEGESFSARIEQQTDGGELLTAVHYPEGNGEYGTIRQRTASVESLPASGTAYVAVTADSNETGATYSVDVTTG